MTYLGRIDHQVQIYGERVELGEVEATLRRVTGIDEVVAIGWPITETGVGGIEAFVADTTLDERQVLAALRKLLVPHMLPRRLHLLSELPLNVNGKFDRVALRSMLERRTG